jgi:hypothetical protein
LVPRRRLLGVTRGKRWIRGLAACRPGWLLVDASSSSLRSRKKRRRRGWLLVGILPAIHELCEHERDAALNEA